MNSVNKIRGYITPRFVIFYVTSDNGVSMIGRSRGFKRDRSNVCRPPAVASRLHT